MHWRIIWRNIFLIKGFFLPPAFKKKSAYGDFILMHLMLSTGAKMFNLTEEMSCYRFTGRGIWSKLSDDDKKQLNSTLVKRIQRLRLMKREEIMMLLFRFWKKLEKVHKMNLNLLARRHYLGKWFEILYCQTLCNFGFC